MGIFSFVTGVWGGVPAPRADTPLGTEGTQSSCNYRWKTSTPLVSTGSRERSIPVQSSQAAKCLVRHRQTSGCWSGNFVSPLPYKDALLEAVYLTQVEKLVAAEAKFDEAMPPIEALRAWMMLFLDYIATKQIIAPALNTLVGSSSKVLEA